MTVDSRQPAGAPLAVPVLGRSGVPVDADAVVVTVTATEPVAGGFATVTACGAAPTGTSNVNFDAGATVPNLVVVAPSADGSICVTSNVDTHLIVDVFGAFANGADVGLVEPQRLVDTRETPATAPDAGGVVVLPIAGTAGVPADATGVMLNLTAAGPQGAGFLTAYPCSSGPPTASNLNVRVGVNRANFVIVAPDAGWSRVRVLVGAHRCDRRLAGLGRRHVRRHRARPACSTPAADAATSSAAAHELGQVSR